MAFTSGLAFSLGASRAFTSGLAFSFYTNGGQLPVAGLSWQGQALQANSGKDYAQPAIGNWQFTGVRPAIGAGNITGFVVTGGQGTNDHYYLSDDIDTLGVDYWPPHESIVSNTALSGVLISAQPITSAHRTLSGGTAASYLNDLYYRIHINPNPLALGNLLSSQQRTIEVWNAYLDQSPTLTGISESNTDGITITKPVLEPNQFKANESRLYVLNISASGPPVITAQYTLILAELPPMTFGVTGTRVVPFAVRPDWGQAIKDTFEWKTEVLTSYSGKEQRRQLRAYPRRQLSYRAVLSGDEQQRGAMLLQGWQSRPFAVPLWFDKSALTAAASVGDLLVSCDTSSRGFYAGGIALIMRGAFDYEAFEIVTLNAVSMAIKSPLTKAWPVGAAVYPLRLGMIEPTQKGRLEHAQLSTYDLQFTCDDTDEGYSAGELPTLYRGLPVLTNTNNHARDISLEWSRQLSVFDFDIVGRYIDDESTKPTVAIGYNFLAATLLERSAMINAFYARAGKLNACWVASGQADFTLARDIINTDSGIRVNYTGMSLYLADLPANRRDIVIKTYAGAAYYCRITAVLDGGDGSESLQLAAVIGASITVAQVKIISFLTYSRLASDSVTIEHETASIAQCSTTFVSVLDDV